MRHWFIKFRMLECSEKCEQSSPGSYSGIFGAQICKQWSGGTFKSLFVNTTLSACNTCPQGTTNTIGARVGGPCPGRTFQAKITSWASRRQWFLTNFISAHTSITLSATPPISPSIHLLEILTLSFFKWTCFGTPSLILIAYFFGLYFIYCLKEYIRYAVINLDNPSSPSSHGTATTSFHLRPISP